MVIPAIIGLIGAATVATTIWRLGHRVPLLSLLMVARATGSPRACVGFIRFCTANIGPPRHR